MMVASVVYYEEETESLDESLRLDVVRAEPSQILSLRTPTVF